MSDVAISVSGLGKRYRIGRLQRHDTLRDRIADARLFNLFKRRNGHRVELRNAQVTSNPQYSDTIWALKDVSFEVKRGEVVGIIGRNGAGKSTLLKILSRITEPTEGYADIHGRVGSLLEVGTGFHPELTGRENIYLNGSILGMRRAEIKKKFNEIVAFAEIEKFMDTPVKHYSSGMYVRLAFAVAAHLDPEILLVDEVLAVGDAAFQKKCLGKMGDVAKQGRTVLFVSHNMPSVRNLCNRCVWIDAGSVKVSGPTIPTINHYLRDSDRSGSVAQRYFQEDSGKEFQLRFAQLLDHNGEVSRMFECDNPVTIEMRCQVHRLIPGLYGYLSISKLDGTEVLVSDSFDVGPNPLDELLPGAYRTQIRIPARSIGPGEYAVYVNFTSTLGLRGFDIDSPGTLFTFELTDGASRRGNNRGGHTSMLLPWETEYMRDSSDVVHSAGRAESMIK